MRSCTKPSNEMIPCIMEDKPLVLSWGQTPRLNSSMRVSQILGFPSISLISVSEPKWVPYLARVRNKSCLADANSLPQTFLGSRRACHVRLASSGLPRGLVFLDLGFVIFPCFLCLPRSPMLPRRFLVLVEEVHPVLPDRGNTMHERPVGKIGLYTRFFDFANFRLPLSTFLVDILRYFCINISQLLVIRAAKIDEFACPVPFSWHTAKNVTRDPSLKATDFNARDYATFVDHPSSFRKFLRNSCAWSGLVAITLWMRKLIPHLWTGMEREDEPRLLEITVGHTVPLLPVAPDHGESELAASVDKLFDEGAVVH
ncbi:hypothetical protein Tco_1335206 [Tanacetum coccineum]